MMTVYLKYHEVKKMCWDNDIYVVQKPLHKGGYVGKDVRLYIDHNGQKQWGSKTYKQNSAELENKIEELYRYLAASLV